MKKLPDISFKILKKIFMGLAILEVILENISQSLANFNMDNDLLIARFTAYTQLKGRIITIDGIEYWAIFHQENNNHNNEQERKCEILDLSYQDLNYIPEPIQNRVCQSENYNTSFIQLISYKIYKHFRIQKRIYTLITNISNNNITFNVRHLRCSISF